MKIFFGVCVAALMGIGLAAPTHASTAPAVALAAPNSFTCVTLGPVYVNGQPVYAGQIVVCVPSP